MEVLTEGFLGLSKYARSLIFSFLRVRDISSLLFVNKKARSFALEFFQENRSIKIQKYDTQRITKENVVKNLFKTFPYLQILKINAFNFSTECLQYLPRTLVYLNLLNCEEYLLLKTEFYLNIQQRLSKGLRELHVEYNKSLSRNFPIEENPYLPSILEEFAKQMTHLESITVWAISPENHQYHFKSLNNLIFYTFYAHSKSLTTVNFNNLVVSQDTLMTNTKITNIKVKTVEGTFIDPQFGQQIFGINDETMTFLTYHFPHIENLSLCDFSMSYRKVISDNVLLNFVLKNSSLKTLYLNSYSYKFHLSEITILQTVSTLSSLRCLGIASCKNFQLGNIASVTPNLFSVRELNLDFTDIDDYSIQLASELFGKLRTISLKCCKKISEEGFNFLTQRLINLEGCNFKYNINFGSTALQNLIYYSKKLRKLKLANNYISNKDITSVFEYTHNIKELVLCSMNDSDQFTSDCFFDLVNSKLLQAPSFWKIKSIDLSNNAYIKDQTIIDLTKLNLINLCFLSLQDCTNLTVESFIKIAFSCFGPKLIELNFCIQKVEIDLQVFKICKPKFRKLATLDLYETSIHNNLAKNYYEINFFLKP